MEHKYTITGPYYGDRYIGWVRKNDSVQTGGHPFTKETYPGTLDKVIESVIELARSLNSAIITRNDIFIEPCANNLLLEGIHTVAVTNTVPTAPAQVGGTHYSKSEITCPHCGKPLQHWDVYRLFPYLVATATKYLWRFRDKGGVEDLKKAMSYVAKLIETESKLAVESIF